MPEKLWDLANLVTGFAVAHSIATTFAMAQQHLRQSLKGRRAHVFALILTCICTVFYISAITWCHLKGLAIGESSSNRAIWVQATTGRWIAVLLFAGITLLTLYGHLQSEEKRSS